MVAQGRVRQCRTATKVFCVHLFLQVAELTERFLSKFILIKMLQKAVASSCYSNPARALHLGHFGILLSLFHQILLEFLSEF